MNKIKIDRVLAIVLKAAIWCIIVLLFAAALSGTSQAEDSEVACFTNLTGKAAYMVKLNKWDDDRLNRVRLLGSTEGTLYIEGWLPSECVVLPHTNFAMLCGRGTVGRYELWSVANGLVHFVRTTNDGLGGFTAVLAMTGTYEEC